MNINKIIKFDTFTGLWVDFKIESFLKKLFKKIKTIFRQINC